MPFPEAPLRMKSLRPAPKRRFLDVLIQTRTTSLVPVLEVTSRRIPASCTDGKCMSDMNFKHRACSLSGRRLARSRPPRAIKLNVPRDLEIICLKAMSKSPTRRYQTAGEMAADLQRFLQGQPILARPMGYTERIIRWCRRYPLAVSVLAAVLVGSV